MVLECLGYDRGGSLLWKCRGSSNSDAVWSWELPTCILLPLVVSRRVEIAFLDEVLHIAQDGRPQGEGRHAAGQQHHGAHEDGETWPPRHSVGKRLKPLKDPTWAALP